MKCNNGLLASNTEIYENYTAVLQKQDGSYYLKQFLLTIIMIYSTILMIERIYKKKRVPVSILEIDTLFSYIGFLSVKGHFLGHYPFGTITDVVVIQQNGELSAHYVDRAGFTELSNFGAVRENPLKAVEDTIEQNDNKFDGIINNTPTMDELEERANRGEQVSISEMFDAAKAEHAAKKQPEVKKPVKKADEKRSIRQYLKQSQDKKPEQPKEKAQEKSKGVEL